MYAIISKRNHEWLSKIDKQKGVGSSHYVKTGKIPLLFETKDLARIELIMYHLSQNKYQNKGDRFAPPCFMPYSSAMAWPKAP